MILLVGTLLSQYSFHSVSCELPVPSPTCSARKIGRAHFSCILTSGANAWQRNLVVCRFARILYRPPITSSSGTEAAAAASKMINAVKGTSVGRQGPDPIRSDPILLRNLKLSPGPGPRLPPRASLSQKDCIQGQKRDHSHGEEAEGTAEALLEGSSRAGRARPSSHDRGRTKKREESTASADRSELPRGRASTDTQTLPQASCVLSLDPNEGSLGQWPERARYAFDRSEVGMCLPFEHTRVRLASAPNCGTIVKPSYLLARAQIVRGSGGSGNHGRIRRHQSRRNVPRVADRDRNLAAIGFEWSMPHSPSRGHNSVHGLRRVPCRQPTRQ